MTFLIWCLLCWFIHIPFTKSISLSKKCHWHFQGSVLAAWHALVNSYLAVAGVLLYQLFKTSSERVLKVLNCRWMLVNSLRKSAKCLKCLKYCKFSSTVWDNSYMSSSNEITANRQYFPPHKYLAQWTKLYFCSTTVLQIKACFRKKELVFFFTSVCFSWLLADVKFTLYLNKKETEKRTVTSVIMNYCKTACSLRSVKNHTALTVQFSFAMAFLRSGI